MADAEELREQSQTQPRQAFAELYVETLRTWNFRGLADCTVQFEPDLTLLVGRNNSGKSRILRALAIALRAKPADHDDLTVGGPDTAEIDIVLAPKPSPHGTDEFEDRTARRLYPVQSIAEEPPKERFAWRTRIHGSQERLGVYTTTALLIFDQNQAGWIEPDNPQSLNREQRTTVVADLVETRRDLVEELTRSGSPIRRILDNLEIPSDRRSNLEKSLQTLGADIFSSSESLNAVTDALRTLTESIDTMGLPTVHPLPVRLEELARSVSIDFNTGMGDLPIRLHGAGARSLTSLQVQSVLYDRRLAPDTSTLRPHPLSLIEEPEAHLHPQAQFELPALLAHISGQTVVSTHSTHLVSVVEPRSIRILDSHGQRTRVVDLRPAESDTTAENRARRPSLYVDEMEKIRRLIERPFGELLFASAVVLGDGATERALLPPLIRHALQARAHGVCVVDPAGMASDYAAAIVKFANFIGIPWILFSDSDPAGVGAATKLVNDYAGGDQSHIVWVPGAPHESRAGGATEQMFLDFDPDLCTAACSTLGFAVEREDLLSFMKKKKGSLGRLLATELIARHPWPLGGQVTTATCWPNALHLLVQKVDQALLSTGD